MKQAIAACGRAVDGRALEPETPLTSLDTRMDLNRRTSEIKLKYVLLADSLDTSRILRKAGALTQINKPGASAEKFCVPFFEMAKEFIDEYYEPKFVKASVETMVYFAKIAKVYEPFCNANDIDCSDIIHKANDLMDIANMICGSCPFQNSEGLQAAIAETRHLLTKQFFDDFTPEELACVKQVVLGDGVTLSGPFYNCERGHPVSLFKSAPKRQYQY